MTHAGIRPCAALAAALAIVSSPATAAQTRLAIRVSGPASSRSTARCFLLIRGRVVGGGSEAYCLQTFSGRPGPNAVVQDRGTMTFSLPRRGTLRTAVRIVQTFAADGRHARQSLTGTVVGGSGTFRRARGTIRGGGTDVEAAPGRITASALRYVVTLR
jgi:hypothetical protein